MDNERSTVPQPETDHSKVIAAGVTIFALAAFIIIVLPPVIAFIASHLVSK